MKKNNAEIINILLENGANVNVQDKKQSTPLHLASLESNLGAVKLLLANEAEVDIQNNERDTPLHLASTGVSNDDKVTIIKLLLKKKCKNKYTK